MVAAIADCKIAKALSVQPGPFYFERFDVVIAWGACASCSREREPG